MLNVWCSFSICQEVWDQLSVEETWVGLIYKAVVYLRLHHPVCFWTFSILNYISRVDGNAVGGVVQGGKVVSGGSQSQLERLNLKSKVHNSNDRSSSPALQFNRIKKYFYLIWSLPVIKHLADVDVIIGSPLWHMPVVKVLHARLHNRAAETRFKHTEKPSYHLYERTDAQTSLKFSTTCALTGKTRRRKHTVTELCMLDKSEILRVSDT